MTNEVVRTFIANIAVSSAIQNRALVILGRLIGETLAHAVVHTLIGGAFIGAPTTPAPGSSMR